MYKNKNKKQNKKKTIILKVILRLKTKNIIYTNEKIFIFFYIIYLFIYLFISF